MKYILTLSFLLLIMESFCQVLPKDVPTLEALVDGHKGKWTGLRERKEQESANSLINFQVADLSEKYEDVKKKTAERIGKTYSGIAFSHEVVNVTTLLVKVPPALKEYGEFAVKNALKHPSIFIYYNRSYKGIVAEINKCQQLLLYGNILSSNYKQQYDRLMEIKSSLQIILYHLQRTLYLCQGIVSLDWGYAKEFEEIMKDRNLKNTMSEIASQIINDYSK